jgi:hypothetical protein
MHKFLVNFEALLRYNMDIQKSTGNLNQEIWYPARDFK